MKSIILKSTIILSVIAMSAFTNVNNAIDAKKVVGTWAYSVPYAPDGYQKGDLVIEEKEGKLSGYTSMDGYKTTVEKMKLEGDKLTFVLYVEGTRVSFDLTFDKKTFAGKVSYSEGTLDITGKKKE